MGRMPDQRRHRRISVRLGARFLLPDGTEHAGELVDMSAGGVAIESAVRPELGANVVIYIDQIGRVEGCVVRQHEAGFAVLISATALKRERIVEALTVAANREQLGGEDLRRHDRVASGEVTQLHLPDGRTIECRILDLSLSGVSLEIHPAPAIGTEVHVGKMKGRVVRLHDHGIGIEFIDMPRTRGSLANQLGERTRH